MESHDIDIQFMNLDKFPDLFFAVGARGADELRARHAELLGFLKPAGGHPPVVKILDYYKPAASTAKSPSSGRSQRVRTLMGWRRTPHDFTLLL